MSDGYSNSPPGGEVLPEDEPEPVEVDDDPFVDDGPPGEYCFRCGYPIEKCICT